MTTLSTPLAAGTYVIDPSHTEVGFVARHAMVTKVRGYFRDLEGTIEVEFDGKSVTAPIATGPEDPTCVTTLQLT